MNIHVSNLSQHVIDADLEKLFSAYGKVNSAIILRNEFNGQSQGTALINMDNDAQGYQAVLCLNKTVFDGKQILVDEIRYSIRNNFN